MPTSLADLPALVVHEITGRDGALIHGTFTHLRSVTLCRSWLNAGAPYPLIGDLIALDEGTRVATFEAPFWSPSHAVQVGSVAPWLDGQWQPWYVTMILDPDATWSAAALAACGERAAWHRDGRGARDASPVECSGPFTTGC